MTITSFGLGWIARYEDKQFYGITRMGAVNNCLHYIFNRK